MTHSHYSISRTSPRQNLSAQRHLLFLRAANWFHGTGLRILSAGAVANSTEPHV